MCVVKQTRSVGSDAEDMEGVIEVWFNEYLR